MSDTESSVKIGGSNKDKAKTPSSDSTGGIRSAVGSLAEGFAGKQASAEQLSVFLPQEIVGGSVPYVAGTEEEAVWNAASQACGTEKVHYTYVVEDKRVWFLAVPSASLASNPDSWCPLAAALPGNSEYWDKETVYLYEQEGVASALRWDPESHRIQVFIGPARTILPRIQSMDANFVTINPDAAKLVPWKQRALKSEQLSRMVTWITITSGLITAVIAIAYILTINFMSISLKPDLMEAQNNARAASQKLMTMAAETLQNESLKHMVRIQQLLDVLGANDGTLLKYEVHAGQVSWEALVPQAFSAGGVPALAGAQPVQGLAPDGRVKIRGTR